MKDELVGVIKVTGKGIGYFALPDTEVDLEVQTESINSALNGDTVRLELLDKELYGRKQAKVVEIVKRKKLHFVGTFEDDNGKYFVIPDDKRMYRDLFIDSSNSMGAKQGDKVVSELVEWPEPSKNPIGKVIKIIGRAGEHNAEMVGIVYESGFEVDFPTEVEKEAREWKERWTKEDHLKDRKDFRDTATFTIDPADAKDFDDAISIKKINNGDYEIGVHIADVSHFVVPKTALDDEAVKRGTSIYLVDRTIPMLPEILSNDLCSLNPNEDKYAFGAVFVMNTNGEVKDRWFGRTLINSDKRFTYEEAQDILDKKSGIFYEELNTLNQIAYKLREEKFKNGAIEFESDEVKF